MPTLGQIISRMRAAGESEANIAATRAEYERINQPAPRPAEHEAVTQAKEFLQSPRSNLPRGNPEPVGPTDFWGGVAESFRSGEALEAGVEGLKGFGRGAILDLPSTLVEGVKGIGTGLWSLTDDPVAHFKAAPAAFKEMGQAFADTVAHAGSDPHAFGRMTGQLTGQPLITEALAMASPVGVGLRGSVAKGTTPGAVPVSGTTGLSRFAPTVYRKTPTGPIADVARALKTPVAKAAYKTGVSGAMEKVGGALVGAEPSRNIPVTPKGLTARAVGKVARAAGEPIARTGQRMRMRALAVEDPNLAAARTPAPSVPVERGVPVGGGQGITRPRPVRIEKAASTVDPNSAIATPIVESTQAAAARGTEPRSIDLEQPVVEASRNRTTPYEPAGMVRADTSAVREGGDFNIKDPTEPIGARDFELTQPVNSIPLREPGGTPSMYQEMPYNPGEYTAAAEAARNPTGQAPARLVKDKVPSIEEQFAAAVEQAGQDLRAAELPQSVELPPPFEGPEVTYPRSLEGHELQNQGGRLTGERALSPEEQMAQAIQQTRDELAAAEAAQRVELPPEPVAPDVNYPTDLTGHELQNQGGRLTGQRAPSVEQQFADVIEQLRIEGAKQPGVELPPPPFSQGARQPIEQPAVNYPSGRSASVEGDIDLTQPVGPPTPPRPTRPTGTPPPSNPPGTAAAIPENRSPALPDAEADFLRMLREADPENLKAALDKMAAGESPKAPQPTVPAEAPPKKQFVPDEALDAAAPDPLPGEATNAYKNRTGVSWAEARRRIAKAREAADTPEDIVQSANLSPEAQIQAGAPPSRAGSSSLGGPRSRTGVPEPYEMTPDRAPAGPVRPTNQPPKYSVGDEVKVGSPDAKPGTHGLWDRGGDVEDGVITGVLDNGNYIVKSRGQTMELHPDFVHDPAAFNVANRTAPREPLLKPGQNLYLDEAGDLTVNPPIESLGPGASKPISTSIPSKEPSKVLSFSERARQAASDFPEGLPKRPKNPLTPEVPEGQLTNRDILDYSNKRAAENQLAREAAARRFADEVSPAGNEFSEDMLFTPEELARPDIPEMISPVENPYDPRITGMMNEPIPPPAPAPAPKPPVLPEPELVPTPRGPQPKSPNNPGVWEMPNVPEGPPKARKWTVETPDGKQLKMIEIKPEEFNAFKESIADDIAASGETVTDADIYELMVNQRRNDLAQRAGYSGNNINKVKVTEVGGPKPEPPKPTGPTLRKKTGEVVAEKKAEPAPAPAKAAEKKVEPAAPKTEAKAETAPEPKAEPKAEPTPEPKTEFNPDEAFKPESDPLPAIQEMFKLEEANAADAAYKKLLPNNRRFDLSEGETFKIRLEKMINEHLRGFMEKMRKKHGPSEPEIVKAEPKATDPKRQAAIDQFVRDVEATREPVPPTAAKAPEIPLLRMRDVARNATNPETRRLAAKLEGRKGFSSEPVTREPAGERNLPRLPGPIPEGAKITLKKADPQTMAKRAKMAEDAGFVNSGRFDEYGNPIYVKRDKWTSKVKKASMENWIDPDLD